MIERMRRRALLGFGLAGLLMTTVTGTASAHAVYAYHGNDRARLNSVHNGIEVQDRECDGNGVYAEVYYYGTHGGNYFGSAWDPDGCDAGIGHGFYHGVVYMFRLCENRVGCTPWQSS